MKALDKSNNFAYLFAALLLFLAAASIIAEFSAYLDKSALSVLIVLMIVASMRSLRTERTWKHTLWGLLPLFSVLALLDHLFDNRLYIFSVLFTLLFFFIGSFVMAFRQVLFEGDIDANKIIGSLTLYLLLGLIWSVIYLMIMFVDPSAFEGVEVTSWQEGFARMAYYSFVTLTTLGYGDILPKNHIAEFFVYTEAVVGVFYMAIIVSSLISLRLAALQNKRKGS